LYLDVNFFSDFSKTEYIFNLQCTTDATKIVGILGMSPGRGQPCKKGVEWRLETGKGKCGA
jgi:hypothetical protein